MSSSWAQLSIQPRCWPGLHTDNSVANGVIPILSGNAQLHVSCLLFDSVGPASWAACPILLQSLSTIQCLAPGMSLPQGEPLCQSCGPLEGSLPVSDRHSIGIDLQKEGGHGKCLHLRSGNTVQRQTGVRLLVELGAAPTHQLHIDDDGFSSLKNLPTSR